MYSLFIALLALGVPHTIPADPCVELVPDALRQVLTQRFPDARLQPKPGAAERITSAHEGFYFGQIEAGADVYFVDHGQWRHVHAID